MNKIIISILLSVSVSGLANAEEVTKEQWVTGMRTALPAAFCNSAQYFRQCFNVTAVECEESAASVTRLCLNEFSSQIPDMLVQPKDGTYWGTKVGECAGTAFGASLVKKRISNDRCNDISNWQ